MSKSMIFKEEIIFQSTTEQVWDLLTNPEMTKQYMFGCEVISDWKIESPILWKGKTEDGKEVIYVKGEIVEYLAGRKITMTMFDPNMGIPDVPKNYVDLTYELIPKKAGFKLMITQGDFQGVDNGEKRFQESAQGRKMVIPTMKKILNE